MYKINLLGSTGSIGRKTLKILKKNFSNYKINFLLAKNNYKLLATQANKNNPNIVGILNEKFYKKLKSNIYNKKIKIVCGIDCYEILKRSVDFSIIAISGISSLKSIQFSIKFSKKIGIVNKESIVSAGNFIIDIAKKNNTKIFPLDSEHYSIYNFLENCKNKNNISKIILTASGGPFLYKSKDYLNNVKLKDTLNHPTWKMGIKNTIDSSTMINKCLEIIEAHYLFGFKYSKLDIIIHPESLIHSVIKNNDGTLISNISNNDMSIPIYAILSNNINSENPYNNLDLTKIKSLNFIKPDKNKFESLKIFDQINKNSPSEIIIFNTSNEYAVNLFIQNKIKFVEITKIIKKSLNELEKSNIHNINDVIEYQSYIYDKLIDMKY